MAEPLEPPPVLIPAAAIQARIVEIGADISRDYAGVEPIVLGVLTGAFMFLADLVRAIDVPVTIDFVRASSYGACRTSSGRVEIQPGTWDDVAGRDVLIVEDVLDTGRTLRSLAAALEERRARSVRAAVLLRKPRACVEADYVGFRIDDRFVVGFGLDDGGRWRHLPYVGYVI